MGYKNFSAAIYCPVKNLTDIKDFTEFEKKFEKLEKHIEIKKMYLETYRHGTQIDRKHMEKVKAFFEKRSITVAGGITTDSPNTSEGGFNVLCYTNNESLEYIQKVCEFTASLFDEIILDDFYFTNCKCPSCVKAKGDRTWADFRLELMKNVSENVIVGPTKKVNPNVKMIIKYPNWYEHFQDSGYNLEDETKIFDAIYTGTETRNPLYAQQHLPKYLSYFNMRYMENTAPGRNGGGWFDPFECTYNLTSYVEQAQLTIFAKAKEAMIFCLGALLDSDYSLCAPLLGQAFEDMDMYMGELGNPAGTATYVPYHGCGEDYLHNYIGMLGIALEPTPRYPDKAKVIFLTEDAAVDAQILQKLEQSLLSGADVIVTSGFVKKTMDRGFNKLVNVGCGDKKALVHNYAYSDNGGITFGGCENGSAPVLIPQLEFKTNDTWELIAGLGEDNNFPVLLKSLYGKGRLYILTIPDDYGNLYNLPRKILGEIRKLFPSPIILDAPAKVGFFAYDNDCFILHSFQPYYDEVKFMINGEDAVVRDLVRGVNLGSKNFDGKTVFSLRLSPGVNRVFKIIRNYN